MLALVISLAVSYFLYNRIKRQFAQSVQPLKIVAAAKALDPGSTISADMVTLIDWPVNFPLQGTFKNTSGRGRQSRCVSDCRQPARAGQSVGNARRSRVNS